MILIHQISDLSELNIMSNLKTLRVMHEYNPVSFQSG